MFNKPTNDNPKKQLGVQSTQTDGKPEQSGESIQWDELLGIPKPACCNMQAACCAVAVPSVPVKEMLANAANGNETCRDLMSVFIPHADHEAARAFYPEQPEHIDRVLSLVERQNTKTKQETEDIVFYHCRYLGNDRKCTVYEDRPTFCRDYPASPMAILVKGCGYEEWVQTCHDKLKTLGFEVAASD